MTEIKRLKQRIEELEKALAFYAVPSDWDEFINDEIAGLDNKSYGSKLGHDTGLLARQTLNK